MCSWSHDVFYLFLVSNRRTIFTGQTQYHPFPSRTTMASISQSSRTYRRGHHRGKHQRTARIQSQGCVSHIVKISIIIISNVSLFSIAREDHFLKRSLSSSTKLWQRSKEASPTTHFNQLYECVNISFLIIRSQWAMFRYRLRSYQDDIGLLS